MIFNILDNTTELWMTKYIIGEIFRSSGATLYKNPSDQTVSNSDDGVNFQSYIDAARDMKIPWDIFENLVLDLPRNLSEAKQIIELLLKELKNSRDKESELNTKLENSMQLIYQFHEATKKICSFQSGVDIESSLAKKRKFQHDIGSPQVPICFPCDVQ